MVSFDEKSSVRTRFLLKLQMSLFRVLFLSTDVSNQLVLMPLVILSLRIERIIHSNNSSLIVALYLLQKSQVTAHNLFSLFSVELVTSFVFHCLILLLWVHHDWGKLLFHFLFDLIFEFGLRVGEAGSGWEVLERGDYFCTGSSCLVITTRI